MLEALGQYKILGLIGIGRMGELYRARDTRAGRTVALRVVADDTARDPARRGRHLKDDTATAPGAVAYMSPEQVLGEHADYRTDIFSLGAVVFEMLNGAPPFSAASAGALAVRIVQIVRARPPAPSAVNPTLPAELDAIVLRMLAKSLDQRSESAVSIAAELRSVAAILDVREDAAGPVSSLVDSSRRSRGAGLWILFAVLASLLAAALMTTDLGQRWWSTLVRTWQQNFGLVLRSW